MGPGRVNVTSPVQGPVGLSHDRRWEFMGTTGPETWYSYLGELQSKQTTIFVILFLSSVFTIAHLAYRLNRVSDKRFAMGFYYLYT